MLESNRENAMQEAKKLGYLDGLKVIACFMVFNFHFVNLFYPGEYCLLPEYYHAPTAEYWIGSTPLNILCGAKFAVRIFLALSGFFVGYRFFLTGDKSSLSSGAIKKYFRLVLPIAVASILIYIMMKAGLYCNDEAAVLANSEVFSGNYNTFAPSLFGALKEAFLGCFITGENQYNGPIWFIFYEYCGSLLVAGILLILGNKKWRYVVYALVAVAFIRSDFLSVILGLVVCDLTYREPKWLSKLSSKSWLMGLLLAAGIFLGSFPPIGEHYEGTIYSIFPIKVMFYYNVAAPMILYALLHLKNVPKALDIKPLTWFTKYTYCFYLLHFPILCTFSSGLFLLLHEKLNYHVLAFINVLLTVTLISVLAMLMHRFVEIPGIKMANWVVEVFDGSTEVAKAKKETEETVEKGEKNFSDEDDSKAED